MKTGHQNRTAEGTLRITKEDGTPLANQEVEVAQTNHKFLFGCTGFSTIPLANDELSGEQKAYEELHARKLLDLFNFITLPFYWGRFEPERGKPDTKRIIKAAEYFVNRGCLVKGHPLCWHTVTADWLMEMSNEEIIQTQAARIHRDVTDFTGLIDTWDVINEVVIMPIFDKYDNGITRIAKELGRTGIIRTMFDAARSSNPGAFLLLNDFDMSKDYEDLIEACLSEGIKIDALGLQSHMHQGYWGAEKTHETLERFSRFNLPIHFTEISLVSGDLMPPEIVDLNDHQVEEWPTQAKAEIRQAEEAAELYKILFEHPAVEAITYWELRDGGWLNAPSGLIRKDLSNKPAYDALLDLVKNQWWLSPTKMVTDEEGRIRLNGYLGEYSVAWMDKRTSFSLDTKDVSNVEIVI
jgi:GH35 family endo-1,4-beta-xylanase